MPFHFPSHRRWILLTGALLTIGWNSAAQAQPQAARAVASVELAPAQDLPAAAASAPLATAVAAPLPAALPAAQIEIGSATQALWALQRASVGMHPRHIDGEQASRSYQRYLKSFETSIPERYGTGLDLKK
ncbi:MAG: DUF3613 domain-containing protein [Comamonas sp.]